METDSIIQVQVCYATPSRELLLDVTVRSGTTLLAAIMQSGALQAVPEIDLSACRVGIFGKLKDYDTVLREHDRIEIYRPLTADPKESRRSRAEKKRP